MRNYDEWAEIGWNSEGFPSPRPSPQGEGVYPPVSPQGEGIYSHVLLQGEGVYAHVFPQGEGVYSFVFPGCARFLGEGQE